MKKIAVTDVLAMPGSQPQWRPVRAKAGKSELDLPINIQGSARLLLSSKRLAADSPALMIAVSLSSWLTSR